MPGNPAVGSPQQNVTGRGRRPSNTDEPAHHLGADTRQVDEMHDNNVAGSVRTVIRAGCPAGLMTG